MKVNYISPAIRCRKMQIQPILAGTGLSVPSISGESAEQSNGQLAKESFSDFDLTGE